MTTLSAAANRNEVVDLGISRTPLREAVKRHGCQRAILVGHNAHFDLNFLNAAVARELGRSQQFLHRTRLGNKHCLWAAARRDAVPRVETPQRQTSCAAARPNAGS